MTAVIFDCDGTLVDSEPLARRAWDEGLGRYGYTIREDDYAGLIGLPYRRVHGFFAARAPALPDADAFWEEYSAGLFHLIDTALEPFDDALETVRALQERGVAVAIASSSPRARLDRTLRRAGLDGTFAVSVAGDEIAHGKPAPDMFLAAAERLGVEPASCVVIEDSAPGVAAGVAAGMRTVGVARAPEAKPSLAAADRVVERLRVEDVLAV